MMTTTRHDEQQRMISTRRRHITTGALYELESQNDDDSEVAVDDMQVLVVGYPTVIASNPMWLRVLYVVSGVWALTWIGVYLWLALALPTNVNVWVVFFVSLGGDVVLFIILQLLLLLAHVQGTMVTSVRRGVTYHSTLDTYVSWSYRAIVLHSAVMSTVNVVTRNSLVFTWLWRVGLDRCCDVNVPTSDNDARFLFYILLLGATIVTENLVHNAARAWYALQFPEYCLGLPNPLYNNLVDWALREMDGRTAS